MDKYNFQYCQKIVVFSQDEKKVLLCKRKGEQDYDGIFSFVGGKMEVTDGEIINGLKREKDEEVGEKFKIKIFPDFSTNLTYTKKDGSPMILPHYYAIHESGSIELNEEYSDFKWVLLEEIEKFEPKIPMIPEVLNKMKNLKNILGNLDSIVI